MLSRWMQRSLMGCLLAMGAMPAIQASNLDVARSYYEQARRETDPNRQLQLLNQSLDAQPTAAAWLVIGQIGQQIRQWALAEKAYKGAYNLANNDTDRILALHGLAEVHYARGDLGQADKLARSTAERARLVGSAPPESLTRLMNEIAHARARLPIEAERIAGELRPGPMDRDYALVPSIDLNIHFAYDRAELEAQGQQEVEELARAFQILLDADDLRSARVIGHTDARGTDEYNQRLSECRALTVQRAVSRQLPRLAGKLCSEGKGMTELLFAEQSPENDRLNRRVEIQLVESCSSGPVPDCQTIGRGKTR